MLISLADGADLLLTGVSYEELAVSVAEYRDVPLATLLWFPIRVNGHVVPILPAPLIRSAMTVWEWLVWRGVKKVEGAQRRNWASRRQQAPRRDGSQNKDRWKFRPMTRCAFPGWRPNGPGGMASDPLSAH